MDADLKERVAVVETLLKSQDARHAEMEKKVNEMYSVIMQLRGAKYFGWFIAASVGYVISHALDIMAFFQGK